MNIIPWLSAMRLRTLPLSISGIILASCFAQFKGVFNWVTFILAILTTLSFQILSNLANDYGDGVKGTDNSDRVGPVRAIQSGKISPKVMLRAIKINVIIAFLLALVLILWSFGLNHFRLTFLFFLLGTLSIVAAIKYTVGSNAFGYHGFGDLFVFIFFGLVSVIGCYTLYAKTIDFIVVLPACTIGLLSTAVLNLNNMRDIISDKKANKKTLAVYMGIYNAKFYHVAIITLAMVLSALFSILYYQSIFSIMFFVTYIPLFVHIKKVLKINDLSLFDSELKKIALTTFFLAILMGLSFII